MIDDLREDFAGRPLALETRQLHQSYGRKEALAGIDLRVPEGSVYVLVGANGAGKTTTLRTILGLLRPTSGTVDVFGYSAAERGAEARAKIGHVPDGIDFGYGRLRVGDLIEHHAAYYDGWDREYEQHLLRALDIDSAARYGKLSKGEARRVQLVLALAHRPNLLLLDEPSDGLDPLARDAVLGLLAEHLASTPTTVLVSTHLTYEMEGLGDCLGVLHRGRLVAQLARASIQDKLVRASFEVPEGWQLPAGIAARALRRRDAGRAVELTLWGEAEEWQDATAASGATLRSSQHLNLEEATRALLAWGGGAR